MELLGETVVEIKR